MYQIKTLNNEDLKQVLSLLEDAYLEEQSIQGILPSFENKKETISKSLQSIYQNNRHHYGLLFNQTLVGFIMGYVLPSLWGYSKGFYAPLHAHSVRKEHRKRGYQKLYKHASEQLVKDKILSHAITLYYNDEYAMNTWFHLGFGLRLIDSIKDLKELDAPQIKEGLEIKELTIERIPDFLELAKDFHFYFEQAPLFMPQGIEDEQAKLENFIRKEKHYLYGMYVNGQPISYMKLKPIGENYLTNDEGFIHICGLYIDPCYQSQGLASLFLNYISNCMASKGYKLLGVDFESFNLKGANFWHKHFSPYTYTLTRRIDEHIKKKKD